MKSQLAPEVKRKQKPWHDNLEIKFSSGMRITIDLSNVYNLRKQKTIKHNCYHLAKQKTSFSHVFSLLKLNCIEQFDLETFSLQTKFYCETHS